MVDNLHLNLPIIPPVVPPIPPVQLPTPPTQPIIPPTQPIQAASMTQLIWSNIFKPEFTGKPDKDAEAYLLGTNDWLDTHVFHKGVKVQHFC